MFNFRLLPCFFRDKVNICLRLSFPGPADPPPFLSLKLWKSRKPKNRLPQKIGCLDLPVKSDIAKKGYKQVTN